jgi:ferredoxin
MSLPDPQRDAAPADTYSARFEPGDTYFTVGPDQPLLHAAEQAGVPLPSSCRNGTCRTCVCRLVSGSIRYRIQWPGLSSEEKAEGWILPCIAYPQSDVVLRRATRPNFFKCEAD